MLPVMVVFAELIKSPEHTPPDFTLKHLERTGSRNARFRDDCSPARTRQYPMPEAVQEIESLVAAMG